MLLKQTALSFVIGFASYSSRAQMC